MIDYMRISITDRCNLRCRYCMPEGITLISHENILRYEEFLRICEAAAGIGIRHIKVTGGEPLVRRGALGFVKRLKEIPGIETVTLTTNGVLLPRYADELKSSGVDGVNISLDTTDAGEYQEITGFNQFDKVEQAIALCVGLGIRTKINAVLLADGRKRMAALAAYARNQQVDVRFIEMMPIGAGKAEPILPIGQARETLLAEYPDLHPVSERRGFGPAYYEASSRLKGRIGWIGAMSHSFCAECNRVRLTSEGQLKPCLCYGETTDLRMPLRSGASQESLTRILKEAIEKKPKAHCFGQTERITEQHPMAAIGG